MNGGEEWKNERNLFTEIVFLARDQSISNEKFRKEKTKMDRALFQFLKDLWGHNKPDSRMAVHGSQVLSGVDLNNIFDGKINIRYFNYNKIFDLILAKALESIR